MSKALKNIVETIVAPFESDANYSVLYNGQLLGVLDNSLSTRNQVVASLMDIIYRDFYCAIPSTSVKSNEDNEAFYQSLAKAAQPEQAISNGWKFLEREVTGSAYLQKQNRVLLAEPGNYVYEYNNRYDNNSGYADIVVNPPNNKRDDYFYYVKGKSPGSGTIPIVRFYFNIKHDGATALIQSIKTHFNKFDVPFVFKCCAKADYYRRNDTAVLYIEYNLFSISIQLLEKVIAEVKSFLNKDVPLLTRKVCDGFSFAENPQGNFSFGQSRCHVIASGIIDCIIAGRNKSDFAGYILETFQREGYDLERLYLNPSSAMHYNFSLGGFKND